ncbi:hypothetical protein, partial [Thomasclavelia cocleata]
MIAIIDDEYFFAMLLKKN